MMATEGMDLLAALIADGGVVVLSGAGLSTESGIPDYRGDGTKPRRSPMTYQSFVNDPAARRRYWARGHLGWRHLSGVEPNRGHLAVSELERRGVVRHTITQNVDGLHQAAGARAVTDLHGRLDRVRCLRCDLPLSRAAVAAMLDEANPGWTAAVGSINPDGDVEIAEQDLESFCVVDCPVCGGLLKPDVVYVGECVPSDRVEESIQEVSEARVLLVLGSSLTVYSGRRFVVQARRQGTPVAVVNDGPTRADDVAALKVTGRLGAVLGGLVDRLPAPA